MDRFTRSFMDDLATKLNITSPDGWYKISWNTLQKFEAHGLLHKYNDSLVRVLRASYPEYL